MSKPHHTPGPWTFARNIGGVLCIRPADKRRGTVASLTDNDALIGSEWRQRDYGNAEANARLIAAAPELLEVLTQVADWWAGGDVPAELDRAMRAVIAKATGGAA